MPDHEDRPTDRLPRAALLDGVRTVATVLVPLLARGLIARRPPVVALAERLDLDRRAVRLLQRLRDRYGAGPLLVRVPGRPLAIVLDPEHVHRILEGSPEPFAAANLEKRKALGHFQPAGVLASDGPQRDERRRLNETALDTGAPVHGQATSMQEVVREEAAAILKEAADGPGLRWDPFITRWYRMVRRITFGEAAADDDRLTELLGTLRARANWGYLARKDRTTREEFLERLRDHLDAAGPGSLARLLADAPASPQGHPEQQIPQWLFAFDPAGIATFRALALIGAHPDWAARIRSELTEADLTAPSNLPLLRATVLESVRLWPTTPAVLRDTTRRTDWRRGPMDAGTGVVVFAPFFHRDDTRLEHADRFAPQLWSRPRTRDDWPLIPFSEGPVVCPGRDLVLWTASTMLASLLERHDLPLDPPDRLEPIDRLPSVLDPFRLRFRPSPLEASR